MHKAFPGRGPEVDAAYQRSGHFLLATVYGKTASRDWCHKAGVPMRKAASEGIGSAGGFLVPTELANAILDIRDSYGVFRRRATIWPMGSDSSVFTRRTGGTAAAFIGEGVAAGSATPTMDQVSLTAKKLGALVLLSSELDEDSIIDLVDYCANEFASALASKEDDCAFFGDGTSTYGGMRGCTVIANDGGHTKAKVAAAGGHNTYATLDAADLGALQTQIRASALPGAAWFASVTAIAQTFSRIQAGSGGGSLVTGTVDGVTTFFFGGFPIIPCQKFSLAATSITTQAMMAFGDMRAAAVLGQRRALTIARSDERYMDTDQIGILATERFDAAIHDMGSTTDPGSLAVLFAP